MAMVAENITDTDNPIAIPNNDKVSDDNISGMNDGRTTAVNDPETTLTDPETITVAVVAHEVTNEVPVLVPGLTLSSMVVNEEAPSEREKITLPNVSINADGCENNDDIWKVTA